MDYSKAYTWTLHDPSIQSMHRVFRKVQSSSSLLYTSTILTPTSTPVHPPHLRSQVLQTLLIVQQIAAKVEQGLAGWKVPKSECKVSVSARGRRETCARKMKQVNKSCRDILFH